MLEYISRHHPPTWKMLASLYEESGTKESLDQAKGAMRLFLETEGGRTDANAWRRLADLCRRTHDIIGELHALAELCESPEADFSTISNAANRFNSALIEDRSAIDSEVKQILAERIATVMEGRIGEASSTDCSRLAWLFLHLRNEAKAADYTIQGLKLDENNEHCRRLATRDSVIRASSSGSARLQC